MLEARDPEQNRENAHSAAGETYPLVARYAAGAAFGQPVAASVADAVKTDKNCLKPDAAEEPDYSTPAASPDGQAEEPAAESAA